MFERQLPARQGSLADSVHKMRDSLTKSLSFKSKGYSTLMQANDEMNVFASDIVSREFILEKLTGVKHDSQITKVEIEDLLIAKNHNSFLPVVKDILIGDKRRWNYLRFIDTIPSADFLWWQGMKHCLMREYEETVDDKDLYTRVVSFQANIQVMEGTSKRAMSSLFKDILQDKDVVDVSFAGALFGYHDSSLPDALMGIMDAYHGTSKQSFVLNVTCGWKPKDTNEQEDDQRADRSWARVLKSLGRTLRLLGRPKPNPQEDDAMSVHSALSIASGVSDGSRGERIPRSHRHRRLGSGELPVVRSDSARRCLTLPYAAHSGGSSKPSLPRHTKSLHAMKRPESLSLDGSPERGCIPERKRPPRATSFQTNRRPAKGDLAAFLEQGKRSQTSDATPSVPVRKSSAHSPLRRVRRTNSSHSASNSSLSSMRRSKTMNPKEQKEGGNPDYDWAAAKRSSKSVVSSAA